MAMLTTSCAACDPPQSGEVDSFHMRIDGELVEFQVGEALVAGIERSSVLSLDGLVAFDDREAKRYDDAVDIGLFAGEPGKFLFAFSMPEQLNAGQLLVNRTQLPRAAEPHIRFERIEDDGARTTFRPLDAQPIEVSLNDGHLVLAFDRLELVDDCDNPLLIEDARIDARARTTTSLQDIPRFADLGIDPRQVEGFVDLRLANADAPFTELFPRADAPRDGSTRYELSVVNACKTAPYNTITFAFDALTQSAPGTYDIAELEIIAYRNRGDPDRLDDDDQYWGNSGLMEIIALDEFLEIHALTQLEVTHMILDGPEPVQDATQDLFLGDNMYVKAFVAR